MKWVFPELQRWKGYRDTETGDSRTGEEWEQLGCPRNCCCFSVLVCCVWSWELLGVVSFKVWGKRDKFRSRKLSQSWINQWLTPGATPGAEKRTDAVWRRILGFSPWSSCLSVPPSPGSKAVFSTAKAAFKTQKGGLGKGDTYRKASCVANLCKTSTPKTSDVQVS